MAVIIFISLGLAVASVPTVEYYRQNSLTTLVSCSHPNQPEPLTDHRAVCISQSMLLSCTCLCSVSH